MYSHTCSQCRISWTSEESKARCLCGRVATSKRLRGEPKPSAERRGQASSSSSSPASAASASRSRAAPLPVPRDFQVPAAPVRAALTSPFLSAPLPFPMAFEVPAAPIRAETPPAPKQLRFSPSGQALLPQNFNASLTDCAPPRLQRLRPGPILIPVRPLIQFEFPVILLDKDYDEQFPEVRPPRPTPTMVTLNLEGSHSYPGKGTLSATGSRVTFFTDAAATRESQLQPDEDEDFIRIENNELSGKVFYLLGNQEGQVTVQLALDDIAGFEVGGPATDTANVVELTMNLFSFEPFDHKRKPIRNVVRRRLTDQRKVVNGRTLGVPLAGAVALRSRIDILPCGVPPGFSLVLQSPGRSCGASIQRWSKVGDEDLADRGLLQQRAPLTLWLYAQQTGNYFLSLGLQKDGITVLFYGDCARILNVLQPLISVGFEYEVNALKIEKRYEKGGGLLEKAEGLPSKSKIPCVGFVLDTEVLGIPPETYGEFVLGHFYDYAALDTSLLRLQEFQHRVESANEHTVEFPLLLAPILSTNPDEETRVFMSIGETVTAVLRSGTLDWSGTCQATFAVPIWMLPVFLANLDRGGGGGMAAKAAAEKAAERDARIDDAVLGLIAACEYYILCFTSAVYLAANDGPKTAASVMFRTDFCSMYSSLTPAQRQAFQAWANGRAPGLLFEGGYNIGGEAWREPGLEIARWLASIWKPDDDKDLLSPPPGFQRHNTHQRIPYAMGGMGLDRVTGCIIAEFRALGGAQSLQGFARLVADAANQYLLLGLPGQTLTTLSRSVADAFADAASGVPLPPRRARSQASPRLSAATLAASSSSSSPSSPSSSSSSSTQTRKKQEPQRKKQ